MENSRDLKTGTLKNKNFDQARKIFSGWMCQASNIKIMYDIIDTADAILIGENLEAFVKEL